MASLSFASPALITIKGKVLAVQNDINTFAMIVRQYTHSSRSNGRLHVRGLMSCHGGFAETSVKSLPTRNDIVSFTGIVAAFSCSVLLVVVNSLSVV